jgi:hypothetical protein
MKYWVYLFSALIMTPVFADDNSVAVSTALPPQAIDQQEIKLMQTELDNSILENLPQPVEPPAHVRLPPMVVKRGEWRGSQCGITRPAQLVFRTPENWQKFWALAMAPYSERLRQVPPVDFSKEMIVGVFRGEQPYPNAQISIHSAKPEPFENGTTLVVRFRDVDQMQGIFSPPFSVQPFHLLKIPAFSGQIVFQTIKR